MKSCVDKIRCYNPYSFYTFWVMILVWMTLSICLGFGTSQLQSLLDLLGLIGFIGVFIVILTTFGTASSRKKILRNAYDGFTRNYKKLFIYETLIMLLLFFLAIGSIGFKMLPDIIWRIDDYRWINPASILFLAYILFVVYLCIHLANSISKLILDKYVGRIITLCVDFILLPNLFVLVVLSGGRNEVVDLLVVVLVFHFLYTLFMIARTKAYDFYEWIRPMLEGLLVVGCWLTVSPLLYYISRNWETKERWLARVSILLSPLFLGGYIALIARGVLAYEDYQREHRFQDVDSIEEITGVKLPEMKVLEYYKSKQSTHFYQYRDSFTFVFRKPVSYATIERIDSLINTGKSHWGAEGNSYGYGGRIDDAGSWLSIQFDKKSGKGRVHYTMR